MIEIDFRHDESGCERRCEHQSSADKAAHSEGSFSTRQERKYENEINYRSVDLRKATFLTPGDQYLPNIVRKRTERLPGRLRKK